jgi:outer membrane protein OmpA-like peptidoglycan-associated protein
LLGSCKSPPKPPAVDESTRRPINSAAAVELQVCKSSLQNTRIVAEERKRMAEVAARAASASSAEDGNALYTVLFSYGSTQVFIPAAMSGELLARARNAPLILLRGRTDGTAETVGESRVARERAAAVKSFLVRGGVDASRIRTTFQPVGDFAADNAAAMGRALNRRVEVELYRSLPRVAASTPAQTT